MEKKRRLQPATRSEMDKCIILHMAQIEIQKKIEIQLEIERKLLQVSLQDINQACDQLQIFCSTCSADQVQNTFCICVILLMYFICTCISLYISISICSLVRVQLQNTFCICISTCSADQVNVQNSYEIQTHNVFLNLCL